MSIAVTPTSGREKRSLAALCAVLCGLSFISYSFPQEQVPSYRVASRLVQLTVVATLDGKPVTGLKAEDFAVLDDGRPRELSLFRYEGGIGRAPPAPLNLPPSIFSNRRGPGADEERDLTALVFDTANTSVGDQMMIKAQTASFLSALAPYRRVAIYQLDTRLHVLHDYTDDMALLREHMEKLMVHTNVQKV